MEDRFKELQEKLATVSYLKELSALEDPFKKGVSGDPDARQRVIAAFKEYASNLSLTLLEDAPKESSSSESENPFTPDEILVLKAFARKTMTSPAIQKAMGNTPPPKPHPVGKIKIMPKTGVAPAKRLGAYGRVVDAEDAQGVTGGNIDPGDRFAVLAKHSVDGYFECVIVDNNNQPTGVKFLIHDGAAEWEA